MSNRIQTLDSLRLFAAFMVVVGHSFPFLFMSDPRLALIGEIYNQVVRAAVPAPCTRDYQESKEARTSCQPAA